MSYEGQNLEKQTSKQSHGVIPPPSSLPMLLTILATVVVFVIFVTPCVIPGGRARELASRAVCGSNMKNIGTGIAMYAVGHREVCPPNLEALIIAGQSPGLFVCPSTGTEGLQELVDEDGNYSFDLAGHCDYIYIAGADYKHAKGTMVTLFELPMNHQQKAVNIGHLDSHVERLSPPALLEEIQKSNDYLAERRSLKP